MTVTRRGGKSKEKFRKGRKSVPCVSRREHGA